MGNPYVGEIRLFAGNFAPLNWRFCDGSLIANQTGMKRVSFGTTYGGNGTTAYVQSARPGAGSPGHSRRRPNLCHRAIRRF